MWYFAAILCICVALSLTAGKPTLQESYSSGCSESLTNTSGSFSSPVIISEPKFYPDNTQCKWSINVPKDGNVTISFTKFNTEACCDHVKILTDSGFMIGQYSGPRFPFKVTVKSSETKRVDIIFKSDESVYRTGFHANYHVYGKLAPTASPSTPPATILPTKAPHVTQGVGDSLMEAFLKMTSALSRIIQSASSKLGGGSTDKDNILAFKSDLYQAIQSMKSLRSVSSSALTHFEEEQLNMVLKHLNTASKKAIKKLSIRLSPSACFLRKKVGPCRAAFRRWYFDSSKNRCRPFIYGGCQPNGNNFLKKQSCESLCGHKKPECPDGSPLFKCFANPCEVMSCPAYPNNRCQSNYCGGCNAEFYDQYNNSITTHCSCPDGQLAIPQCVVDPCQSSRCHSHPRARCRTRSCGGCFAEFVDDDGNVIDDC
ncbi:uncharacterized protein LOC116286537 [Actinia tenebrosa]|uniref:Uncharacterized protein LOC116286537 n=1 Tax=Actinia tenebrosa TaxID=6105 RepID=A0A6P8GXE9_ACTTE|nr:uncharacterized protein LOC116286537 [Actinia tenebrosa]